MNITKESLSKRSLNQRGNPRKRQHIPDDNEYVDKIEDQDKQLGYKNPLERFSDELISAGERYGFKNTWFISNFMAREYSKNPADHKPFYPLAKLEKYPESSFINSCYDHCLAECHDVVHDSAVLIGPTFYIENIADWSNGWDGETFAMLEPDFSRNTLVLVKLHYGSWFGGTEVIKFPSKGSQQTLLNDIYRMMPYLEKYETTDPSCIKFSLPATLMTKIYDNYERRPYAWAWTQDLERREEVKKEQIDQMWDKRNKIQKTYTQKQIKEAISFWKKQLRKMN